MGQVTLKIENTYLCFLLKCVLYPWEASYQPLDQCPAYSKPFYFQQRTIICSLFRVVFTLCSAGLCLAALSWNADKVISQRTLPPSPTGMVGEGSVLAGMGRCGAHPGPSIPLYPWCEQHSHSCCTSHMCLGTSTVSWERCCN